MFHRIQLVILGICYKVLQTLRKHGNAKVSSLAVFGDDDLGLRIIFFGEFETETLSYLRDFFKTKMKKKQFIDVGANIGNHTNGLCSYFSNCHAFEPNPRTFQLLKANMTGKPNVICHQLALSNCSGEASFHQDSNNSGKSRVIDMSQFNAQNNNNDLIKIKTMRLDDIINKHSDVGLIKIDVEGHELKVLEGAVEILKKQRPFIMIEVLANEISEGQAPSLNFLRANGYTKFLSIEPKAVQISLIDTIPSLRWINHVILVFDLIILGSRGVVTEELMITDLKTKNYNAILVSA